MKTRDFHYDLPPQLIAQQPCTQRSASRLLVLDKTSGDVVDSHFSSLLDFLNRGDLLVFNDTRVIPARLHGHKPTGGKLEVLVERLLSDKQALVQIRCSKSPKPGSQILINNGSQSATYTLNVETRQGGFFVLSSAEEPVFSILEQCGHMPLPPYIQREDNAADQSRYQTVYASNPGAVAAPTAGLHFDETLLAALSEKGIKQTFVTLHVGAGTFQPVRCESLADHNMHSEYLQVSQTTVDACRRTRERGGRIVAVGTTSVRCLETASGSGELQPYQGETDIFIYPGYTFTSVDALITNFHLPESTLIMLVSAFAGKQHTFAAYQHAVEQQYRFFSYGDAMLIL